MRADLHRSAAWATVAGVTAVLYALTARIFALLGVAPSDVSPLYPAAGLALAAVLVHGRAALVGVALGAMVANSLPLVMAGPGLSAWLLAALMSAGSVAQAALAAALVRRYVQQPLTLTEPRDIALFFGLGALLATLVGATVGVVTLALGNTIAPSQWLLTWLTWWSGDALGTLLGAPIALTLMGLPRDQWSPRRAVVGLSLLAVIGLMALGAAQVTRFDDARRQSEFEREALNAAAALNYKLQEPLLALEAMRSVFVASDNVTRAEMQRASERWIKPGSHVQAIGWSERVARSALPVFEASVRAEGLPRYKVRNRSDQDPALVAADEDVMAIRYIEPRAGNEGALGVNALSIPTSREAILRSIGSNRAAATAGFRLSQDKETSPQTGLVMYHVLFNGDGLFDGTRRNTVRGVVFATLRVDDLLRAALAQVPDRLSVCILDLGVLSQAGAQGAPPTRLSGPPGCDQVRTADQHEETVQFADRSWTLRISSLNNNASGTTDSKAWVLSMLGMVASALLGTMLLSMTGRTQRIEQAVAERTAALSEEIREREQAEAAMRESEQRFRNIFNNVPIGVVYTDLDGHIQHVNPHFSTLTGYSTEQLLRMDVYDYIHPDDARQEQLRTGQLLRGEVAMHRAHHRVVRRDGNTVWVQATLTLLRNNEGQPRRLVGVMEDITEHLKLVEAERARDQAESANHAKSEFLSRMSHELRTPLNAMLGFAQLLELDQRHPLVAGQRSWVSQIQHAGWHLLDMINDVLDLSRIESGNMLLRTENLDLEALVEASVSLVAGEAGRRGIRIKTRFSTGTVAATGDITRVKQILINLLSNAVKYNHDGGQIDVLTRVDGPQLLLVISDTGLGMTEAQLAELFQPFNRLGRERSGLEGTGIGLVISRRLAELMGGSLHAESSPGVGSSFLLALPMALEQDTVRSDLDTAVPEVVDYQRRVVHYIEDNETNIEVMRGILAQRPQLEMTVSMTGTEAREALRQQSPDVILLDMNLPDITGVELLQQLKADPVTAGIPVVVVSADALGPQIDAALDAGALRYLTKPVSVSEVLRVLDELLDADHARFT